MSRYLAAALALMALSGCAGCAASLPAGHAPCRGELRLGGSDGRTYDVGATARAHRFTVLVFYSESCPCFAAHEPRLKQLFRDYRPRDVALLLVSFEVGAAPARDASEARRRGYPFPLLSDPGGRLARHVRAESATHAVIFDQRGRARYSGGIDSDMRRLRADATPHLRNALDALLAGREPNPASSVGLGCALQLE